MAAARHCPSWADLQPELLGLVLRRLTSLGDRVRLAAVCRSWRHSARLEPLPPPFPWITLRDSTFLSIPDGKIYRLPSSVPVPPGNSSVPLGNSRCIGSVGNWLFLEQHTDDGGSLFSLMNPFSKDVVQLSDADTIWCDEPVNGDRSRRILFKLVLLSSMDLSPDSLFAVLITDYMFDSVVSICQPSTTSAFRVLDHEHICDVAFVDGKLYALSGRKLFVFEVESSGRRKRKFPFQRKFPSMKCIADVVTRQTVANGKQIYGYDVFGFYLVESKGKLLHVRRLVGGLSLSPGEDETKFSRTLSFEVFEVDLTASSSVQWSRLNSLEGEALFVGRYSKVLHASEYGVQADCIYFISDYGLENYSSTCSFPTPNLFRDCGVFNMRNGTITPLLPETMIVQALESIAKGCSADKFYPAHPTWFFPC